MTILYYQYYNVIAIIISVIAIIYTLSRCYKFFGGHTISIALVAVAMHIAIFNVIALIRSLSIITIDSNVIGLWARSIQIHVLITIFIILSTLRLFFDNKKCK